jgi:hypothetical protein
VSKFQTEIDLLGVDCTSATDCTAVGNYTTYDRKNGTVTHPLAEHWNGTKWSIMALAESGEGGLSGVSCRSATSCVAVGGASIIDPSSGEPVGTTLIVQWDGSRWTAVANPKPPPEVSYALNAVSCPSTTDCTLVGVRYAGATSSPLIEHWHGTSWSITPSPTTPTTSSVNMTGVSCTSPSSCTAVGTLDEYSQYATPLIEQWDGNAWSIAPGATIPALAGGALHGITCTTEIGCTVVGAAFGRADSVNGRYTLVERDR